MSDNYRISSYKTRNWWTVKAEKLSGGKWEQIYDGSGVNKRELEESAQQEIDKDKVKNG